MPMIAIVERHNRLNGVRFSVTEYVLIGALAGGYAVYFASHHKVPLATVGGGIAANCFAVALIGLRTMLGRGSAWKSTPPFWKKEARLQHRRDNPHMLRETLILTVVTVVPFVAAVAIVLDAVGIRTHTRP